MPLNFYAVENTISSLFLFIRYVAEFDMEHLSVGVVEYKLEGVEGQSETENI